MSRWSIPLDRLAAKAGTSLETVARKVAFDAFRAVVLRSPVDTGRFRANWNVSFDAPNYATTFSTNQARGQAEAAKALRWPVGGVAYIANGLPYGPELEFGSSRQAPSGMVRVTASELSRFVERAVR